MNSHITDKFREDFADMPANVEKQAWQAYRLFIDNPHHPSLRFKQIHSTRPIYSVRIGIDYRAVGVRDRDDIIWFWIGSHAEYDKLILQLRKQFYAGRCSLGVGPGGENGVSGKQEALEILKQLT